VHFQCLILHRLLIMNPDVEKVEDAVDPRLRG
jgi:hypothetical protein